MTVIDVLLWFAEVGVKTNVKNSFVIKASRKVIISESKWKEQKACVETLL